jgi:hypothetical protein
MGHLVRRKMKPGPVLLRYYSFSGTCRKNESGIRVQAQSFRPPHIPQEFNYASDLILYKNKSAHFRRISSACL